MSDIKTFSFKKDSFDEIKTYKFGKNWPVVYVLENSKEVYIGQTVSIHSRAKQHLENPERQKLNQMHVISDDEFNVSAALDIESWLIQYIAADGKYVIQNGNGGLKNHNYYDKVKYKTKFETIWDSLREKGIVQNTLTHLKNSDLFKYSPYKTLTEDQLVVARAVVRDLNNSPKATFIISGKPGTGKTILATYICKFLQEKEETRNLKVGLVVPMASLRNTIGKVFSKIKGLKSSMVIGPNDVVKSEYDLLIVDESHRLQRRKGIMGYGSYDDVNRKLGLSQEATQLDWIMKSSRYQIFFYDPNQSIKPADVRPDDFAELGAKKYELKSQMRVEAGDDFIQFIEALFDLQVPRKKSFENYDFRIFDDIREMVSAIKQKDSEHKLARVVSGYAWPWHTKPDSKSKQEFDIEIDGVKLIWNSTTRDWVNSPNALNEVGCIHTVQGYDLNYVGVIVGPELYFDKLNNKLCVDKNKYFDTNGRNGISDPEELERYVKNIYKTLLTRGIRGSYMFVHDSAFREHLRMILGKQKNQEHTAPASLGETLKSILSPYSPKTVSLPLYDSVGCGDMMYADPVAQENYEVPEALVRPGAKYFVLRTSGDSMDMLGINDGDLILCQKNYQASSGSIAVVLIGDEAVLKEIIYEKDGLLLKPRSTNPRHKSRKLGEDDDFKVLGIFIKKLDQGT
jgi:uncharacterized protein